MPDLTRQGQIDRAQRNEPGSTQCHPLAGPHCGDHTLMKFRQAREFNADAAWLIDDAVAISDTGMYRRDSGCGISLDASMAPRLSKRYATREQARPMVALSVRTTTSRKDADSLMERLDRSILHVNVSTHLRVQQRLWRVECTSGSAPGAACESWQG